MIPPDIASRLRIAADSTVQPIATAKEVSEALAEFVPGQRILAQIQSVLPNGNYRAMVAQRELTLALPFSAKSGDSLDLEVVNTDGKLTLAVVAKQPAETATREAVATTLSRTGQLIATLLADADNRTTSAKATPLNGSSPIAARPPTPEETLAPLLQKAITESGVFYESHLAQWVEGKIPTEQLLREPQGQLSQLLRNAPSAEARSPNPAAPPQAPTEEQPTQQTRAPQTSHPGSPVTTPPPGNASLASGPAVALAGQPAAQPADRTGSPAMTSPSAGQVSPELTPMVQHQLDALASQTYTWQGQVWPGQDMYWEISEEQQGRSGPNEEVQAQAWNTSVRLTLPLLGDVEASLQIRGDRLSLVLGAGRADTEALLRQDAPALQRQLTAAGLNLDTLGVARHAAE